MIGTAGLLTLDVPAAGSLAFGSALACSGLVFTAVAAVTAQLSPQRAVRPRRGVRRAGRGVHPARRRRRGRRLPDLAVAAGLVVAGASVCGRPLLGVVCCTSPPPPCWSPSPTGCLPGATSERACSPSAPDRRSAGALLRRRHWPGVAAQPWVADPVDGRPLCLYGLLIGSVVNGIGDEIGGSAVGARHRGAPWRHRRDGAGLHRRRVQHARHGGLGVRDLADAAVAPGGVRPARRDAAGRRGGPDALAGKPSGVRDRSARPSRC